MAQPAHAALAGFGPEEMQELYRSLFQSVNDVQYVLDADRDEFLLVNDAFLRLTGFSRESLLGQGLKTLSIVAPEQRDEVLAKRRALGDVPVSSYEIRILTPRGPLVLDLNVRRITLKGRSLILGSGRDVTARFRSIRYQEALLELARLPDSGTESLKAVTERLAATMEVDRVSLWLFDAGRTSIRCEDLFRRSKGVHEQGQSLEARSYPAYFKAMEASRVIAADEARTDARTREFASGYLAPLGITSMMDVSVRVRGVLAGVLCHEHVGPARSWTPEEQAFATAAADRVSVLLETAERRRAEEALRGSEERLRMLLEQMPAIVWTTDPELRWATSMGAGLRLLGQTPNQYAGVSMYDYFKTRDPAFLPIAMHLRALAGEAVTYDFTWEGVTWHCYIQPLRGADGKATGCIGVAIDITNRSDAERKLRESEERFRNLSEATTEGIAISEKGRILYTNQNLAAMYGYEPAEIMGKEILSLVAPESRDLVSKHVQTGAERTYEAVGLRKDGTTFPYEVTGKTFQSEGRAMRMAAIRDLTKVKQLSATLEREVRLEKKKTLEAFQANVRIFQLTEKIRAAYESTTKLVNSRNIEELLASAVALLCDPAGLDYREAAVYVVRDGSLESIAAFPEHRPERIPCDSDHPLALAFREQPGRPADAGGLVLPLKGQAGSQGLLEVRFHSTDEVRSWQENILRTLANSVSLMIDNLNLYEMVRRQSITDMLTGAHNRRYFDEKLRAEVERAVRYKRSMALVMIDLDGFKGVNDSAGHPQGDAVLSELGAILRKQSRQIDVVSRYGGDEFALILPETSLENAVLHADRIREMVASKPFPNRQDPSKPFRVTLSVGVADVEGDRRTAEAMLDAADRACFLAKRGGKNRVKSVRDLA